MVVKLDLLGVRCLGSLLVVKQDLLCVVNCRLVGRVVNVPPVHWDY